ncbi:MAG: hypothetical protein PHE03_09865 [Bacteroidales bacterium]|nr:hypothetical protein [Bacteroidales bacterium]MDD3892591.1 hypothetical protein [Bacteroidales bacterium]
MSALENNTVGKNAGVDITFERFLNNNYYYLVTASIFDSKYKADDNIWRNTRFNKNFAINVLFGKEFMLRKSRMLGANLRLSITGGERMSPVDIDQTMQNRMIFYDETRAFEEQSSTIYNMDISITYRANKRRYSGVWALQVKNILGCPMDEGYLYDYKTNSIERMKIPIIIPALSYKVEF